MGGDADQYYVDPDRVDIGGNGDAVPVFFYDSNTWPIRSKRSAGGDL